MRTVAAVAVLLTVAPAGSAQPAGPGFTVHRIWTAESMANSSGTVSVTPDPSRLLIVLDVTATGASPVTVPIEQFAAASGPARIGPIGAAPVSRDNFDAFIGFPPGWRSFRDAENREVRIGREKQNDPIQLIIAPGAMVSVVYIVPKGGPPLTVTLPGAGAVPLIVK